MVVKRLKGQKFDGKWKLTYMAFKKIFYNSLKGTYVV